MRRDRVLREKATVTIPQIILMVARELLSYAAQERLAAQFKYGKGGAVVRKARHCDASERTPIDQRVPTGRTFAHG